ncbi:unnamed protein product [Prorocentrum cordatum]|uniref:Uncharacterized protein n=1 Tax=Prorocentrum cordatum TaxID=2364126 RepID=A0ABN9PYJ9_9DINO|nr:unnamed protein product [Polarella glacialis]
MGWSRALAVCQRALASAADRAELASASRVVGRQSCPGAAGGAHLERVDNFASLSLDRDTTERMKGDTVAELRESGLPVHEGESAAPHAQLLGWVIDGERGSVSPTPRRARRLIFAARALLAMPKVSAQQAGEAPRQRWPGARRELPWATGIAPLAAADLRADWLGRVSRADASEWGRGVRGRDFDRCAVQKLGGVHGRRRFRDPSARAPREEVLVPLELYESLIDVEPLPKSNVLASSSASAGPADLAGPSAQQRPTGFEPLEWAALAVAGGISAVLRWMPSEANPADLPSRRALRIGAQPQWGAVASLAAAQGSGHASGGSPEPGCEAAGAAGGGPPGEGWNPERGAYMLAELKVMLPQFSRGGLGLPQALQAPRGWRRRVPARARPPLPLEIVALIAARLIDIGQLRAAIYVLATSASYLRPSTRRSTGSCQRPFA